MIWTKKITVCNWSLINWKKHKYNTVICRPSTCFWIVEYFDHSFHNDSLETLIHKSFKTYLCSFYSQITYLFTFYWKYTYWVFHIFTYPWFWMTWYFSWGEREFGFFCQLFSLDYFLRLCNNMKYFYSVLTLKNIVKFCNIE